MATATTTTETPKVVPTHRRLSDIVGYGMIACVAFAPWPFGANVPWAWWTINLLVMALLVMLGLSLLIQGKGALRLPASIVTAALLFAGVVAWILLQAGPSPYPEWSHPIWALLPSEIGAVPSISIDPDATREALARLCAYGGMFAISYILALDARRAEWLFNWVLLAIGVQALFGLVRAVLGMNDLLGFEMAYGGRASGSFINANHFAGYTNLGVAACLAILLRAMQRDADSPHLGSALARVFSTMLEKNSLLMSVLAVSLLATVASASRGAFLALGIILVVVAVRAARHVGRALLFSAVLTLGALGYLIVGVGGETLVERFDQLLASLDLDPEGEGRLGIWLLTVQWIEQRPWLGHGYGAYLGVFTHLRTEQFPKLVFDYAHNTYLELAVETGLPAAIALVAAIWLALQPCRTALARGTSSDLPLVALLVTAITALHALVDFAWQMPAVAITWACLAGLGSGRASAQSVQVKRKRTVE